MGYCFMTIEKIKSLHKMDGKYKHNYRENEVSNADPDKKDLNEELVSLDGKTYNEAFKERIKNLGYGENKNIRKNAVMGFEVVTTFSREDKENISIEDWKKNQVKWLKENFNANPEKYGDNVLSVMYHGDENGNVHCHAFIIPIDDKGHLNAQYYVRSRQKLIELQDSYGKLMFNEHGLNRGIEGKTASHNDIKRFYAALNASNDKELPEILENETVEEYRKRANEVYKDLNLKNMGLVDKNKKLLAEQTQKIKNEVSHIRDELYAKLKDKTEKYDELIREFGSFEQIVEKCEKQESLDLGIKANNSENDNKDIVDIINLLTDKGNKIRKNRGKFTEKDSDI